MELVIQHYNLPIKTLLYLSFCNKILYNYGEQKCKFLYIKKYKNKCLSSYCLSLSFMTFGCKSIPMIVHNFNFDVYISQYTYTYIKIFANEKCNEIVCRINSIIEQYSKNFPNHIQSGSIRLQLSNISNNPNLNNEEKQFNILCDDNCTRINLCNLNMNNYIGLELFKSSNTWFDCLHKIDIYFCNIII